jgi:outer membrane protein assembly factor BamB
MTILIGVLILALRPQDDERIQLPLELPEDFERRWQKAAAEGRSKELFDLHAVAWESFPNRLAKPDPDAPRWVRATAVLAARLEKLPAKDLEPHVLVAQQVLESVRDPVQRRLAAERYAYVAPGRRALLAAANQDADEGRVLPALRQWALEYDLNPTSDLAARQALVHARTGDSAALAAARSAAKDAVDAFRVGGASSALAPWLKTLAPPATPAASSAAPPPGYELPLGRYDFRGDGYSYARENASSIPAAGRAGDKLLVVFTNGWRIVAVDPARATGGPLEEAIEWRYPREGTVRPWSTLSHYPVTPPAIGVTVSGSRAYVTHFTREPKTLNQQVGRRSERLEGPACIRALDLATGESIWDTESLEIECPDGSRQPMVERAEFGRHNYSFSGPPLIRGDRLYAAVMTSPVTPRHTWAVCLDARSGSLIWSVPLATKPALRQDTQVLTFSEEGGTLVYCSNFGIAAALDAETGRFEWVVKYREIPSPNRPAASAPLIAGSVVYLLPQDADGLIALDRWTGREIALPAGGELLPWNELFRLAGRCGDWLLLTGLKTMAYRVTDGHPVFLSEPQGDSIHGRAVLAGGRAYLPGRKALHVFETRDWKHLDSTLWGPGTERAGNVVLAEDFVVLQTDQLLIGTGADAARKQFGPKAEEHPPAARQFGEILENGGLLKEAVGHYRRALKAWEQDPAWQESAEALRKKLATLREKLGDDFPE